MDSSTPAMHDVFSSGVATNRRRRHSVAGVVQSKPQANSCDPFDAEVAAATSNVYSGAPTMYDRFKRRAKSLSPDTATSVIGRLGGQLLGQRSNGQRKRRGSVGDAVLQSFSRVSAVGSSNKVAPLEPEASHASNNVSVRPARVDPNRSLVAAVMAEEDAAMRDRVIALEEGRGVTVPGATMPNALPAWRGYSVLDKGGAFTNRGGTAFALDLKKPAEREVPKTRPAYVRTVAREIELPPDHLAPHVFRSPSGTFRGTRGLDPSEQLDAGLGYVDKARGQREGLARSLQADRKQWREYQRVHPHTPGWMSANRAYCAVGGR